MADQGPLSGQKLGDKYLLGDLIGQGGFGAVYQAQHLLLGRPQAIKILLEQHFASPKFRERFLREARTLAALDHINILPAHEFGIEGNRAYLVMPYISGGTLQTILAKQHGPLGLDAVWRALSQIAAALDYAHARNVAHLDLKPGNLLLHEDGRLLLADFGLAHLLEQGAIEGSTSLQFGTPAYMAPEHLQGRPEQKSDVYALGIMLYQMLTGRVPFEGTTPAMVMLKHLNEPPPPLATVRPDLPPPLESVLAKALTKNPTDRYATAGALSADFQGALGGQASLLYTQTRAAHFAVAATLPAQQPPAQATAPPAASPYAPTVPAGAPPGAAQTSMKSGVSGKAVISLILGIVAQAIATTCIIAYIIVSLILQDIYPGVGPIGGLIQYILLGVTAFLPGIFAVYLGRQARKEIGSANGRLRGERLAKIGFWLGSLVYGVLIFQLLAWPVRRVVRWRLKE